MHILVVGGGISGPLAALALHRLGLAVTVFEAVARPAPLGVGINLLPHAAKELEALGLLEGIRRLGVETAELVYCSKHGVPIWREPRGLAAGYRWPQISIHRGALQMFLLERLRTRLGPAALRLGRVLVDFEETAGGRVRARFAERGGGAVAESHEADLLIGCDGIHSAVRARLHPGEGPPVWNGAVLWRGISRRPPFLSGRSMIMAGHERQKFVCYPITGAGDDGRMPLNWVAELRGSPDRPFRREDWNREGRLGDFLPAFEGWRFSWLEVPAVIRAAERVYEYPMVDRDPLPYWGSGPVTLLGDAAHPMYPVGSNGVSQALLDVAELVRAIRRHGPTPAALSAYEAVRRPATAAVVAANREQGPERVMQLVEERAPGGVRGSRGGASARRARGRRRPLQAPRRFRSRDPERHPGGVRSFGSALRKTGCGAERTISASPCAESR